MKKEDKNIIIDNITASLKEYEHFYLTDIATLNAAKTSVLRKECSTQEIKLMMVKNTLLRKALENLDASEVQKAFDNGESYNIDLDDKTVEIENKGYISCHKYWKGNRKKRRIECRRFNDCVFVA